MKSDSEETSDVSMRIIETTIFTRQMERLVADEEKQKLLDTLIISPVAGDIIKGSAGLRKLRWAAAGRGKRGGIRVIYYWLRGKLLYLLLAYPKNKKDDLSAGELKLLKKVVEQEKHSWIKSSSET